MKRKIVKVFIFAVLPAFLFGNNYRAKLLGDRSGNIYIGENIDTYYPLASLTKMMTGVIVLDAIKKGDISYTDAIPISSKIALINGSKVKFNVGESVSVEDLLKATLIYSANNAAHALAEHVAGDVDTFIDLMNQKAQDLDIDVKYDTPSGLPPHMTGRKMDMGTARGIYKLSLEILNYNDYIDISSMKQTKIRNGKTTIKNRNNLLDEKGIYGIKTGFHNDAKFNISVASNLNDLDTIVVVFGSPSSNKRKEVVKNTIDDFFDNYENTTLLDKNIPIGELDKDIVKQSKQTQVNLYPDKDFNYYIKKDDKVEYKNIIDKDLTLPLEKGNDVGRYSLIINDQFIHQGNLLVHENVQKKENVRFIINRVINIFKGVRLIE